MDPTFTNMKKLYLILAGLLTLLTACNSDQADIVKDQPQPMENSIYEQITTTYLQKQQNLPTKTTLGFWGWLKRVASADAKAAAAYAAKNGMKSNWKEALLVGAAASIENAIAKGNSKISNLTSLDTKPYRTMVLPNIHPIKVAQFSSNSMDDLGYYHYVIVNEVLKDSTLATLPSNDLSTTIYDKVYQEAHKLGFTAIYEKEAAVAILSNVNQLLDDTSDAQYNQLYAFVDKEDLEHFKPIEKLYTHAFFTLNDTTLFTAYSKEMESAVLTDTTLPQQVKDVLLLEMATYRFGNIYYFSAP